jgi:hypothetical protein
VHRSARPLTRRNRGIAIVAVMICLIAGTVDAQTDFAPPLTAANLTRLRMLTTSVTAADPFPTDLTSLFGLGTGPIMAKQLMSTWRGGEIYVAFLDTPHGDVVMTVKDAARIAVYLTDATRQLRATAMIDQSGQRLIPNGQAAAAFRLTLERWNELALEDAKARQ